MKTNKVEYEVNDNFTPLKILNLNNLIIKEIDYTSKYKFKTSDNIEYSNTSILKRERLNCTWKETYKIRLNHFIKFIPGDSIGLLCPNNDDLVYSILERLGMSGNKYFIIEQIGRTGFKYEGSLYDFFKHVFDFTSLPKKAWLIDISKDCIKAKDLEYLCSKEGTKDYLRIIKNWNNVIDILDTFECKPNLKDLIMNCQTIKPRYFSLTNKIGEESEIFISTVKRYERYGHVSNFIHTDQSNNIQICHRESKLFGLKYSKKLFCICTGTGVAPFLSFIKNKSSDQFVKILYGFRNIEDDLINSIQYPFTEVIKVLSSNKMYVTDYILQNINELHEFIKEDCLVYVCGRPDMQKNVFEIFKNNFMNVVEEKRMFFDSWI